MKTTHQEIEITYDEKDNRWHFELRGRQRSVESLLKAKEFIDKPVTEKEEKTFKRVPIWYFDYSKGPREAEVTSIAEGGYGGQNVWVQIGKERSKKALYECFPRNEKTNAIVAEWVGKEEAIDKLREQRDKLKESLKPITID